MTTEDKTEDLQKAFEQGFSEARGEEAAPAVAPPAEPAPAPPAQEGTAQPATDEKVDAAQEPTPLEGKVAELEKLLGTSLQRLKSAEGRVAALQRDRDKPKEPPPEDLPNPGIAKMREDYPDIADQADAAIKHALDKAKQEFGLLTQEQVNNIVSERMDKFAHAIVEREHKGWKNDVKKPEFAAWLETQPDSTRSLAESDNPLDAIELLDQYKASRKAPVRDTRQLDAASVVGTARTSAPSTVISDDAAFEMGFNSARGR